MVYSYQFLVKRNLPSAYLVCDEGLSTGNTAAVNGLDDGRGGTWYLRQKSKEGLRQKCLIWWCAQEDSNL